MKDEPIGVRFVKRSKSAFCRDEQYCPLKISPPARLASLISALCLGLFPADRVHQGTCSGTVRIHCIFNNLDSLQRTLFLLVSPIYARLRNAQRTWFRSGPRCGKSLHCMFLRSDGSLPKFPFSGMGREPNQVSLYAIGLCGTRPAPARIWSEED
jgi:hypothetical protein